MRRSVHLGFVPLAVFLALLVGRWVTALPNEASDTRVLVAGTHVALDCIGRGDFLACGTSDEELAGARKPYPLSRSAVAPFPLVQYLPAGALIAAGASDGQALYALGLISVLSFIALLVLLWVTLERAHRRVWAPVIALIVLGGPLLFYGSSTFAEMLAALLTVLFVEAVLSRRHWAIVAGTLWLAGVTKETAVPFLIALGVVAAVAAQHRAEARRLPLAALALGSAAALATSIAFNLFRFGTAVNQEYVAGANFTELYGLEGVPSAHRVEFFVGLLIAPNGGLLVFWPAGMLLLAGALAAAVRAWRRGRDVDRVWPAALLLVVLTVLLGGFASFYQPFGWFSWGQRLTMPWIPPLLLLSVIVYGDELAPALRRAVRGTRHVVVAAAVATVLALPHVAVAYEPSAALKIFRPDARCPFGESPDHLRGERWFDCINHIAWARRPAMLDALGNYVEFSRGALLFAVAFAVAALGLLAMAHDRLERAGDIQAVAGRSAADADLE